jgi:hypothetical protein
MKIEEVDGRVRIYEKVLSAPPECQAGITDKKKRGK